jgi:glyoxylase-like metal-dependent hydrolase (beta-lactamase superfamily II)
MTVLTIPTGILRANSYILADETTRSAVVVDCGALEPELIKALDNFTLHAILLTHGHWDHILGVAELKRLTGAPVAIHTLDAPKLSQPSLSGASNMGRKQTPVEPDLLLKDEETLSFGAIVIQVLHTPGHTQGGVCFLHETTRSLFTGDTLFAGTCGRVDLPGGDWQTMLQSLHKLRGLNGDYKVYPGHDRTSTLEFERRENPELQW